MASKNIAGQRFGRLVAISSVYSPEKGYTVWECVCDCGGRARTRACALRTGNTASCGCIRREQMAALRGASRTHGKRRTPEYDAWAGIRTRCFNTRSTSYAAHGGRGITIDPRWATFEAFLADMGERPSEDHEIDRIDNDGPYSPENCRWSTRTENARNRRNTRKVTFRGETLPLVVWLERGVCEVDYSTFYARLRRGMTDVEAMTTPSRKRGAAQALPLA